MDPEEVDIPVITLNSLRADAFVVTIFVATLLTMTTGDAPLLVASLR